MARRRYHRLAPSGGPRWERDDEDHALGWLVLLWEAPPVVEIRAGGAKSPRLFAYFLSALFRELLRLKSERESFRPFDDEPLAGPRAATGSLLRDESSRLVPRVLRTLDSRQRELLRERLRSPATSIPQVARVLGILERTCRYRWSRVEARLQEIADEAELDGEGVHLFWFLLGEFLEGDGRTDS